MNGSLYFIRIKLMGRAEVTMIFTLNILMKIVYVPYLNSR